MFSWCAMSWVQMPLPSHLLHSQARGYIQASACSKKLLPWSRSMSYDGIWQSSQERERECVKPNCTPVSMTLHQRLFIYLTPVICRVTMPMPCLVNAKMPSFRNITCSVPHRYGNGQTVKRPTTPSQSVVQWSRWTDSSVRISPRPTSVSYTHAVSGPKNH